jgi:toluene monooxygenase system ferredoxin subunit
VAWQKICAIGDVAPKAMQQFTAPSGTDIVVLNGGDAFYACQAMCPHLDTPLEEGMFDGTTLTCHQHLWQWAIASGDPEGLAELPLPTYPAKTENGEVYVDVE